MKKDKDNDKIQELLDITETLDETDLKLADSLFESLIEASEICAIDGRDALYAMLMKARVALCNKFNPKELIVNDTQQYGFVNFNIDDFQIYKTGDV